ncbi:MAG TPA: hypothetical protein PLD59_15000 [Tepidisphaeraceae bacterium]|nr:hypothetical protein [Tepidisphaeraceae bacterium]
MKHRKAFWFFANVTMLAVVIAIAWATLLPAIWGPSDDSRDRRARNAQRR